MPATTQHPTMLMDNDEYEAWLDSELARIETTVFSENPISQGLLQEFARLKIENGFPDIINELLHDNRKKSHKEIMDEALATLHAGMKHEDKLIAFVARMLFDASKNKSEMNVLQAASHFDDYAYATESLIRKIDTVRDYGCNAMSARLKNERVKRGAIILAPNAYPAERSFQFSREAFYAYREYAVAAEEFLFLVTMRVEQFIVDMDCCDSLQPANVI